MEISEEKQRILNNISLNQHYLIKGSAGTGKTLLGILMAQKFLSEIKSSQKILFLTFSKLSKWQIINSIKKLVDSNHISRRDIKRFEVHNFHSLWWNLILENKNFLGIKDQPLILLDEELVSKAEKELNGFTIENIPNYFRRRDGQINLNLRKKLVEVFKGSGLIYYLWKPEEFGESGIGFVGESEFLTLIRDIIIERNRQGDFSHTETIFWIDKLLEKNPNLLNLFRYRYPVIIIDEFQDTDIAQWAIIKKIAPNSLIALADKKQTIHIWRGADPSRLNQFQEYCEISSRNIFELKVKNRFNTANSEPPQIEWISLNHRPLTDRVKFNACKKTAKINCKNFAFEAISEKKSLAILSRTNLEADEITEYLRNETNGRSGVKCERLGADNSPFELGRTILINLILQDDDQNGINYIANNIFAYLFPKIERCTRSSRRTDLRDRYRYSCEIYAKLNDSFAEGIETLIDSMEKLVTIKGWKPNYALSRCLNYFAQKIRTNKAFESPETSIKDKRRIIDMIIREYEEFILPYLPKFKISIMTNHQAKSREFDWVLIPWFSSLPWERPFGHGWMCSVEQDKNLFNTARTRAKERFIVIKTTYHMP